jgi:myo-inositol-1(or 4)-monophosphatase
MTQTLNNELQIALKAARSGAGVVLENFGKSKDSRVKGNSKGLVTATDLASEKAILEVLSAESVYEIMSEESLHRQNITGPVWVVDPLDGTNNFARALPFFAVSVGLMDGNESLVGIIIDVVGKKEYYAIKGGGTFCNGERIILPGFDSHYIPMVFLNHGYAETDRAKFKKLTDLLASDFNILKLGTTALELCYIASGVVDGFICSGDELWDFAAGVVIAKEAGCIFTDWKGKPWDGTHSHLLIARPEIHQHIIPKIKHLQ